METKSMKLRSPGADDRWDAPASWGDRLALAVALVLPTAITWLYFFQAASLPATMQLTIFNIVKIVQFSFPLMWVVAVQRRPIRLRPEHGRGIVAGVAFGATVGLAMFALYWGVVRDSSLLNAARDQIEAKVAGWGIDSAWKFAALGVFYSLIHSLLEEYYWRWFVFGQLRRATNLNAAIVLSSLGFMAHHVLVLGKFFGFASPATWALSLCVAVGGAAWAWLYERTGSLLGPWMSHLLVDAAIFAVGYDIVRSGLAG